MRPNHGLVSFEHGHPKLEYLKSVILNHFMDRGEGKELPNGTSQPATLILYNLLLVFATSAFLSLGTRFEMNDMAIEWHDTMKSRVHRSSEIGISQVSDSESLYG
jgi:hypothetical protein